MTEPLLGGGPGLAERLRQAHRAAGEQGHRLSILVSGEPDWTRTRAEEILRALSDPPHIWLTDRARGADALPLRSAHQLLGRDLNLLIYDAHDGFDPDGFGAATGAILGGGVLVLLTPPLAAWPGRSDPQAERIAVWPHSAADLSGRFLERLARVLTDDPSLISLGQAQPDWLRFPAPPPLPPADPGQAQTRAAHRPCTTDQHRAVAAILKTARGRARRPLVLRAHRGRGKSAALGLAAGELLAEGGRRILVTAPSRAAAEAIFKHARAVLRTGESGTRGALQTTEPVFVPPADLVTEFPHADLLLVDEAACIPAPLLEAMLEHYGRIVFATTVHGYEGTGRGFDIRFRARLDQRTPDWRALELEHPVRWSPGDPLEALTFRALLLDAVPAPADLVSATRLSGCRCERLDRDVLARDDAALRQVFGLLVLAHYQTRPMDLRMLLDGPNIRVMVLREGDTVVATLLAALEGGFEDAELRDAVYRGRRRPRGHLLPQTLSAHAGILEAPSHRYLRVVRIAVHPAIQDRGLGRTLLAHLEADARSEGIDCLGASFGATPELIQFWHRCGYAPVQIGTSRNGASGEHALVVLRGLTDAGLRLLERAEARLESALGVLLPGPLRALDPAVVLAIVRRIPPPRTEPDRQAAEDALYELTCFVEGHRTLEASLPLLAELSRRHLRDALEQGRLSPESAQLLLAATRQLRPVATLAGHFERSGREDVLTWLRQAADGLRGAIGTPSSSHLDAAPAAV